MSSGVGVDPKCLDAYLAVKSGKAKYAIFNGNARLTEIIPIKQSTSTAWEDLLKDLPETECRWAVYDLEYETGEGLRKKLCFISWSPDMAGVKQKFFFASSRDALRKALEGIACDIQVSDLSDLEFTEVVAKAERFMGGAR